MESKTCSKCGLSYKQRCRGCASSAAWANGKVIAKGRKPLIEQRGYVWLWVPSERKYKQEHVLIAERVLGRKLAPGEMVHHVNGIKSDNRNRNLVICTQKYHAELHHRMSSLYQKERFGAV